LSIYTARSVVEVIVISGVVKLTVLVLGPVNNGTGGLSTLLLCV